MELFRRLIEEVSNKKKDATGRGFGTNSIFCHWKRRVLDVNGRSGKPTKCT